MYSYEILRREPQKTSASNLIPGNFWSVWFCAPEHNDKLTFKFIFRLATNTSPTEFSEPKVRILWKLAQEADFDIKELESLKEEMHHYEKRLQKLQNLKTEIDLSVDQPDLNEFVTKDKMGKKLAKHTDSVQKLHAELEAKIVTRHSEF